MARRILALGFVLPLLFAAQAQASRLIVTIQGTRDADGYLYVALFSKPDGFPDDDYSAQHKKPWAHRTLIMRRLFRKHS